MATPPIPLQTGSPLDITLGVINQNFNNTAKVIQDLGASQTSTSTFSVVVGAGVSGFIVINLFSVGATTSGNAMFTTQPASAVLGVDPIVDFYIDVDDANHVYPFGSNLTSGMQSILTSVFVTDPQATNALATIIIQAYNRDSISHTIYAHTTITYFLSSSSIFA